MKRFGRWFASHSEKPQMNDLVTAGISVSAPGSSANLAAGFDVLGLAIDLRVDVGIGDAPERAQMIDGHHPAMVAYQHLGGKEQLWSRSQLPMGRGLGFSGAARAAGAMLAIVEREGSADLANNAAARQEAFGVVADLEGHPDNAAASIYGGLVAASHDHVAQIPIALDWVVLVWIPENTTSTDKSRTRLEPLVQRADAVVNLAAVAHLVVGVSQGDDASVRAGMIDRLHQPQRLEGVPASAAALTTMLEAGAIGAWLSGSGPTVAGFFRRGETADAELSLAGGQVRVVDIDEAGVTCH